jgi:tetratricopeptide (TPR) repeat protein
MLKRVSLLSLSLLLAIAGVLPTISTHQLTFAHTQLEKGETEQINVIVLGKELLEKQIAGGQQHTYSIHLAHGQFLFVDVQQLGIDVVIQLIDVDEKLRIESNAPDMSFGAEPFYWIAERDGIYKVVIRPAQVSAKTGKYTIKIGDTRAAKVEDLHFLEGQNKLAQGEKLRNQGKKRDIEGAVIYYNSAIEHWREVGQVEREGVSINSLAYVTYLLGDTQKAVGYVEQAAKIRPESGGKAESLSDAASLYHELGQPEKALELANQAIEITEKTGDKIIQSIALNTAGKIYRSFNNEEKSLLYFDRALKNSREIGSKLDEALSLHNIGVLLNCSSETEKALIFFKEAIKIRKEVGDLYGKLETLTETGHSYLYLKLTKIEIYRKSLY